MDPMTMMALASIGGSMMGQKQLGGIAPAFNPGSAGGDLGLGGGPMGSGDMSGLSLLSNLGGNENLSVADVPKGGGPVLPQPTLTPPTALDPAADALKQSSLADIDNAPEGQGGLGGFFGGLDKGLQSPSQVLGLGLLGQLGGNSPALPLAGLLGMGLMNRGR